MRYVGARIQQEDIESSYRFFVSEGIKILTKNTAESQERQILQMNFNQFMNRKKNPVETRTAEEIIDAMKAKLDFLGGGHNEHDGI